MSMDIRDQRDTEVGPGSCKIAHSYGRMIARNLSSELLLVLYADKCKLGKMIRLRDDKSQMAFAEAALGLFFRELPALDLQKQDLLVHAIGGVGASSLCFTHMQRLLRTANVSLAGTDLANNQARSVWLDLSSGRLIVRTAIDTAGTPRMMQPDRLAS